MNRIVIIFLVYLNGTLLFAEVSPNYTTPTKKLDISEYPVFEDDLDLIDMSLVLDRQLERFQSKDLRGTITLGNDRHALTQIRDTLLRFSRLVHETRACIARKGENRRPECMFQFSKTIQSDYLIYAPDLKKEDPRFGEPRPVFFTGYYTPSLEVSRKQQGLFRYPIYAKPTDDWYARIGRYPIDFQGALSNLNLELFYAKSRFDLYLLQLEGGGRVRISEENLDRRTYLTYAGSNGRQWRFLSTLMLERGWINRPGITQQREFIKNHPEKEGEIFSFCPSYVYFRESNEPPEGNDGVSLTDNRSIATDKNFYEFKGLLAFVRAERPRPIAESTDADGEMMPFSRFVIDQDTGGAIKGKGRVDFYFGEGAYAELAANTLKARGDLFFLVHR